MSSRRLALVPRWPERGTGGVACPVRPVDCALKATSLPWATCGAEEEARQVGQANNRCSVAFVAHADVPGGIRSMESGREPLT